MTRQKQQAAAFRMLHAGEPFVMPNPWDPGSARMLEALGFQALATTSSGFAFTLGRRDGKGPRGVTDRMRDQEYIASVSDTEAKTICVTEVWRSDQHHAASLEKGLITFGLAGAMKVPHAVAMHAPQVRPALTWLLGVAIMGERRRLRLVLAATVGDVAPVVSLLQTAAGLAPLDPVVARRRGPPPRWQTVPREHNGAARFRRGHRHAHDLHCAMSREPELLADVERREKRCGGSSALASSAATCPLRSYRIVPAGFTAMPGGLSAQETASRRNRA